MYPERRRGGLSWQQSTRDLVDDFFVSGSQARSDARGGAGAGRSVKFAMLDGGFTYFVQKRDSGDPESLVGLLEYRAVGAGRGEDR